MAPPAPYSLLVRCFPPGHFIVQSVEGREALNEPYRLDVDVLCSSGEELVERVALGQPAVLVMRVGSAPRSIHGIVSRVDVLGPRDAPGAHQFRLRIVPRLWLLRRRKGSRIFQNQRVDEVVDRVLHESHIATRWTLSEPAPKRPYCTQYEETDLAFVSRLLAEAGIFYYFSQPTELIDRLVGFVGEAVTEGAGAVAGAAAGIALNAIAEELFGSETVVFCNEPPMYPPIPDGSLAATLGSVASAAGLPTEVSIASPVAGVSVSAGLALPTLHYLSKAGSNVTGYDMVTRFVLANEVRPNRAEFRDYDPTRPNAPLIARAPQGATGPLGALAVDASISLDPSSGVSATATDPLAALAGAAAALLSRHDLEVYEHHGDFLFPEWDDVSGEASLMLRQERRRAHRARGASTSPALTPGHAFTLEDHPIGSANRSWVVTSLRLHGRGTPLAAGVAHVEYENDFECVPDTVAYVPTRPKRRRPLTTLTATVVGPAGEEIYTDELGQIKVQFHWDRRGGGNEHSSCWIRTVQTWGGPSWGTQFIPRIGMEVLVVFEGGDPDKPIVSGCVYNGTHPPSFKLPEQKTRSGFKTSSSPGGAGNNELSFEDAAGREQIYVHAERDLDVEVERNHTRTVRADETQRVSGNRMDEVVGDVHERVEGDKDTRVAGDESHEVMGNRVAAVHGDEDRRISKNLTTRVEGRDELDVSGNSNQRYGDDLTVRVTGCHTLIAGKHDAKRSVLIHAEGYATLSSTDVTEIAADSELILRCGKSMLRITPDKIEIVSGAFSSDGGGSTISLGDAGMTVVAKKEARILTDKVLLKSEGASMSLGREVKLDGDKILLNSPDKAEDPPPEEPAKTTKIEVADEDGVPLAHQRYLIVLEDGSERSGVLDKDGKAEIQLEQSGKIYFPDLAKVETA